MNQPCPPQISLDMDAVLFLYGAVAFTPYSTELSLEAQIKAFSAELRAGAAAGAPDHLLLRLINTLCVLFMISMLNSFARLVALAERGKLGPHQAPASPAPADPAAADPAAADPAAAERAAAERAAARRVLADWVPAGWVSAICAADPAGWAAANQDSEPADSAHAMASAGCAPAQQSQAHRNQAQRNEAQRNTDPADPVPVAPWPADRTRGPAVRQPYTSHSAANPGRSARIGLSAPRLRTPKTFRYRYDAGFPASRVFSCV